MSNQFSPEENNRKKQAIKVAQTYKQMRTDGKDLVVVCGTLNDVSYSDCLSPLLRDTDLTTVSKHKIFNVDVDNGREAGYFRMGAYRIGVNIKQKDYLLLSPFLYDKIKRAGMNRKGTWSGQKPN